MHMVWAALCTYKVIALVFIASVFVIHVEHMCDDDDNDKNARPHAHNGQMIA